MAETPELSTPQEIERRSGYQSLQPVTRPAYWGVDLDPARRPGVPMMRDPHPWPNTSFPPVRQAGRPASPKHGRPNKTMPPVFGTAVPLQGLSGAIRRFAYRYPDHYPSHWLLKMLGDRVDSLGYRARKLAAFAAPLLAVALLVRLPRH